jgi:flagellar protein FlbD
MGALKQILIQADRIDRANDFFQKFTVNNYCFAVRKNIMIKLTKFNGEEFIVNSDLILYVESRPDTYITMTTSDRILVRESSEEVIRRRLAFMNLSKMGFDAA